MSATESSSQGAKPAGPSNGPSNGIADALVDEAMPEGFDWRRMVQRYPWPALTLAAVGGWMLGHRRGAGVLTALAAFAADQLVDHVNQFLDDEVL
ncbi:MAG: hypothetical protein SX243_11085 [Acidobacteriota bacterium]|nr:hypothetical protein [Acidobacteriota bacterium]